jgi:SPP1 gp7 family putative phage head morphogenesis protein
MLADDKAAKKIVDMEEFAAEYEKLNPYLVQLYTEAGTQTAKGYGVTFEVDAKGIKKIGNHLHRSTDSILKTTAEALRADLEEGFLAGEGVDALAQRVRDRYEGISADRARTIARTETVAPANDGAMQGYKQAGVEFLEWIATEDELTRDSHAALNGKTVKLGEDFKVGSDTMPYPGGGEKPEENINCRCTIAGVVE